MKTLHGEKLIYSVVILMLVSLEFSYGQQPVKTLELDKPIERQIKGGETQTFQFNVKAGQYARAEVEQKNIDVVVSLFAPDGKLIVEMDGKGGRLWRERVSCIAEKKGAYRVEIKAYGAADQSGDYSVNLAESGKLALDNRKRLEAEAYLSAGRKFDLQSKFSESVNQFEVAVTAWRELNNSEWEAIALLNLGWAYQNLSKNEQAIDSQLRATELFQKTKDRVGESKALNALGTLYRNLKQYESAIEFYEKALVVRRETGDKRGEANSLFNIAIVFNVKNKYDEAVNYDEQALVIRREIKDKKGAADSLNNLGTDYESLKQSEKAISYFLEAATNYKEMDDRSGVARNLNNLARVYENQKDYDKARDFYIQESVIRRDLKERENEAFALYKAGATSEELRDGDKARDYYIQALQIYHNEKVTNNEAAMLRDLAQLSRKFYKDFGKALNYYRQALAIYTTENEKNPKAVADTLLNLGIIAELSKNYNLAEEYYRRLLTEAINNGFDDKRAIALSYLGDVFSARKNFAQARDFYNQALVLFPNLKDQRGAEASNLLNLGKTFIDDGQPQKSLEYSEKALVIWRASPKSEVGQVEALNNLGLAYNNLEQSDEALRYYDEAMSILKQMPDKDAQLEENLLIGLAKLFENQYQYEKAIDYYEQVLADFRASGDSSEESITLNHIAENYTTLNKHEKAWEYYRKALDIAETTADPICKICSYSQLANIYYTLGEYEKSLDYVEKILAVATNEDNRETALNKRGLVLIRLGQYDEAKKIYEETLRNTCQSEDKLKCDSAPFANLGLAYLSLKEYKKALQNTEQALAINTAQKHLRWQGNALSQLGDIYVELGHYEKARPFYEQALEIWTKTRNKDNEASTLSSLGNLFFILKKYDEARSCYNRALALSRESEALHQEAGILSDLMNLSQASGDKKLAVIYGKQAVNLFQEIRGNIKGLDKKSQQSFLADNIFIYRRLSDILISEGRLLEAQAVLNLIKEGEYKDLSRGDEAADTVPYSRAEAETIAKIDKLVALGSEQTELRKQQKEQGDQFPAGQLKRLEQIAADIKAANVEFDNALIALSKADASVGQQLADIKSEKNLQAALQFLGKEMKTGAVALYTVIGTEAEKDADGKPLKDQTRSKFGWVILVTKDTRKAYPIDVTDLEQTVFQFKTALSSDEYDPKPLAEKLYTAIFRQTSAKQKVTLEQDLNDILGKYPDKTLMWSLDGVLRYIPMAALHDGKGYLVEKYRNVVFTKESLISLKDVPKQQTETLGLGVSAGNKELNLSALPGVDRELADIIKQPNEKTGILNGTRKVNGNFRKQEILNLKDDDNAFQMVHIASHYSFNPTDQNSSYLLIGDGKMTFGEMKTENNLFGTVDLLTLSACDTGVSGNGREAEGFAYLAQSLGAKSVIASLWKVSDAGTPELMIRFYKLRAAQPAMSKGEAFREAQLEMLGAETEAATVLTDANRSETVDLNGKKIELSIYKKDEKHPFAHPHYWASFVLIGNWR